MRKGKKGTLKVIAFNLNSNPFLFCFVKTFEKPQLLAIFITVLQNCPNSFRHDAYLNSFSFMQIGLGLGLGGLTFCGLCTTFSTKAFHVVENGYKYD